MSSHLRVTLLWIVVLLVSVSTLLPSLTYANDPQWVKYTGNPVLTPTPNAWDADYTVDPKVLYDGKIYRMWYNGGGSGTTGIGYASSANGVTWFKHNGPVLTPGPPGVWDSAIVQLGSVNWNGTLFQMWYRGSNTTIVDKGAIGLATSKDGVSWTKYFGNPVLKPSDIDQGYLASPFVIKFELTYSMWYTGRNATYPKSSPFSSILYATSYDGIRWNKVPSAVLSPSTDPNAWDSSSVYSPSAFYNSTTFWLWYSALGKNSMTPQIGFATSPDGSTWTRSSLNPILSPGAPSTWDSAGVEQPTFVLGGLGLMLYYDGFSTNQGPRIGLATAPHGFAIPEFPSPSLGLFLGALVCVTICVAGKSYRKPSS